MEHRKRKPARVRPRTRSLYLEVLEDRRLLANVTVGNLNDVVNGNVTSIANLIATQGADGISLREAVLAANADAAADVIDFAVTGMIQLTNTGHAGEIAITNNLTINGPGAGALTIRAFAGTIAVGDGARIFNVSDGNLAAIKTVAISGLTLTGGDISNAPGGAIRSYLEDLTLTACTITGNRVVNGAGGAVWQLYRNLNVNGCTISGNTALVGGGIYAFNSTVNVTDSTISGNTASQTFGGPSGGGIGKYSGSLTVTNSTISGNSANGRGGGIDHFRGTLVVRHSTITENVADADNSGHGQGGGVFVYPILTTASLDHTIVAGNLRQVSTRDDVFGTVTARYSLIGDNSGATITNNGGNQIGTGASPINALLGSPADYGGPTRTHALLAGSPAIDAGDPAFGPTPVNDQRGAPFARVVDGDGAGGARIDIGAYERQPLPAEFFVVDTLADESDGNYSPGDRSLREAIVLANSISLGADIITFAASLTSGGPATILLSPAFDELVISDALTIFGPGANLLTIDANDPTPSMDNGDGNRVFTISDGNSAVLVDVEIVGLTITGADPDVGAAIVTAENLTVVDSIITGNAGTGINGSANPNSLTVRDSTISYNGGGGVYKRSGSLEIERCTIAYNNSASPGGGIDARYVANVEIRDSTIVNNLALGSGGGIYLRGGSATVTGTTISSNFVFNPLNASGGGISSVSTTSLIVRHSTITGNSLSSSGGGGGLGGGGLHVFGSPQVILDHTIVAGNQSYSFPAPDVSGSVSARFSLIGDNTDATITDNGGNQIGTGASPVDPLLGLLADNGGPTMTHALLAGSPAIDAGDPAAVAGMGAVPQFDQRGFPFVRVYNGDAIPGKRIDIGAFEFAAGSADFDQDGDVDGLDFLAWQIGFGTAAPNAVKADGDADDDQDVDATDLALWEQGYGAGGEAPLVAALSADNQLSAVSSQLSATDHALVLDARLVDLAMAASETIADFGRSSGPEDWARNAESVEEEPAPEVLRQALQEFSAEPRLAGSDFGDIAVTRPSDDDDSAFEDSLDEELVFASL